MCIFHNKEQKGIHNNRERERGGDGGGGGREQRVMEGKVRGRMVI